MEVPPPGPPPSGNNYPQDSPAFILMQMKNSVDERGPGSPTPHKLSYLLSQSPPQGPMHPQLPPPSSFNFMPNFIMTPPPMNPMNNMNSINNMNTMNNMNSVPPPLRMSIPRLSLPVARPSSAPGSPQTPNTPTSSQQQQQPSTPTTPISSPKESRKQADCKLKHCLLCERGQPSLLVKAPTWASIMRVVFYCLKFDMNEKQYFSLKTDVYSFMLAHWDKLCLNKKKSDNWHKQIQDMLSHSKNLFESGMDKYKQNGFWRLKTLTDPWTITKDRSPRKSSDPPPRDPTATYGSSDEDVSEQEADGDRVMDRSPKRVKVSMELTNEEEPITVEDVEKQRKLENEVSSLRLQLSSMSDTLVGLKEELKQREDSLQTQREAYEKLTEEFCVLQIIAQREANNSGIKLPPATSTANLLNNIIHANQYSHDNANPFSFTPQELRKLEELKRAEDIRKSEEMRKIDEIRAAMAATGSLPYHKLEELRSMGYGSLAPKQVEELRTHSPRTPRDGSPRDMSRDPSPRADALLATSPREMIMRDGSPRTEVLLRNAANEAFLREAQRESIMREAAQRSESLIRDSTRIVKRNESPRLSPRGSPRTTVHSSSHATPGSPLANHVRDAPYSREHTPSSLNLNSPRDVLLATSNLSLNSPRGGVIHDINSPRELLHTTSNLSLNSPRDILNNSGNSVSNTSNVPPSNPSQSSSSGGFFFSQPPVNSPRDLLSINNILNTKSESSESSSSASHHNDEAPSKYPGHQVPHINLRNLHHLSSPSPPSSPSTSSASILSTNINNLNLSDSIEALPSNNTSTSTSTNSNTPNRLSPLHQVLPQYIPKSRSPTHEQSSGSPTPSSPMLVHMQQMQLQQQQQQLLQQQAQQQQQLQQLHQQYQYQLQLHQQQQLQQNDH